MTTPATIAVCVSPDCDGRWHTCWNCGGEGCVEGTDEFEGGAETCPERKGAGGWLCPAPLMPADDGERAMAGAERRGR